MALERPAAPQDQELGFAEFQRIYGPIKALTPKQAADLFAGAPFEWWVAGGWSTELSNEQRRFHDDLEICIARADIGQARQWLREYHLWDTHEGGLRFLWPDSEVPDDHEQLWMRRDGYSPWLLDLMITPVAEGTWFYKRDHRIARPLADALRLDERGVPFQRPEITLLFKARRLADKDEQDFDAVLPALEISARNWLREAIELTERPDHPWLTRL